MPLLLCVPRQSSLASSGRRRGLILVQGATAWRADNSRFDRFLRGDRSALSRLEKRGMRVFYGKRRGNCASCHSGTFQTDHSFRAIAMPQVGPGKGDGTSGHEDFGRERVSGDPADRYRFRVPTLRNIALTAPYGHAGAFGSLEAMVRHHLDTVASLQAYDPAQCALPPRDAGRHSVEKYRTVPGLT